MHNMIKFYSNWNSDTCKIKHWKTLSRHTHTNVTLQVPKKSCLQGEKRECNWMNGKMLTFLCVWVCVNRYFSHLLTYSVKSCVVFCIRCALHLQSKCFFFGPMHSSVVALHTDLASPWPARLWRAASSLSLIVCPAIVMMKLCLLLLFPLN